MNEAITPTPLAYLCGAVGTLGSALIALAVGAGASGWLLAALVLAGVAQGAYAVRLLRGGLSEAWMTSAALLAPTAIWLAAVVANTESLGSIPLVPMLVGSSLAVASALLLLTPEREGKLGEFGRAVTLPAVSVACLIVATATTFALSGTLAGEYAVPHGEHSLEEALHDIH